MAGARQCHDLFSPQAHRSTAPEPGQRSSCGTAPLGHRLKITPTRGFEPRSSRMALGTVTCPLLVSIVAT